MGLQYFIIEQMVRLLSENGYHVINKAFDFMKWNVLLIEKNNKKFIAKYMYHKESFYNELRTYSRMPSWWPVKLVDSFEVYKIGAYCLPFKVIIITYFENTVNWKRSPVSRTSVVELFEQLDYLHSINILHNDTSFDNILLSIDGTVAIVDFEKIRTSPYQPFFEDYYNFLKFFIEDDVLPEVNSVSYSNMQLVHDVIVSRFPFEEYDDKDKYPLMHDFVANSTYVVEPSPSSINEPEIERVDDIRDLRLDFNEYTEPIIEQDAVELPFQYFEDFVEATDNTREVDPKPEPMPKQKTKKIPKFLRLC